VIVNGRLAAWISRGDRQLIVALPDDEPERSQIGRALARELAAIAQRGPEGRRGWLIEEINGVGDDFTPTTFHVWGAKALAGIGHLSDTVMDRAITLELRRKLPHENIKRLRHAEVHLFKTLSAKLARFLQDYAHQIQEARPELPDSLNDRAQDNWEPLFAIADVAGGHRESARHEPGPPGHEQGAAALAGRGHPDHEAGGGDDAVVRPEDGGPQPADAFGAMSFRMNTSDHSRQCRPGASKRRRLTASLYLRH
jgi:hypothetical protein